MGEMENQEVKHIPVNGKYRIVFEKAASANKADGFKVEVNGDEMEEVMAQAKDLYLWAQAQLVTYWVNPQ